MQLLSVKSMIRYFPPNGTAGLARYWVKGNIRSPLPPARTTEKTFFMAGFYQDPSQIERLTVYEIVRILPSLPVAADPSPGHQGGWHGEKCSQENRAAGEGRCCAAGTSGSLLAAGSAGAAGAETFGIGA